MILHGRTFSAVLYGHIEIVALNAKGQIAIQIGNGNSFVVDNQIIEATAVYKPVIISGDSYPELL